MAPVGEPVGQGSSSAGAEPRTGFAARHPLLGSARARLIAGVVLAIVVGFLPAHLVAGMRERSAFGAIDSKVAAVQAAATAPDSYAALDAFRAEQLDDKRGARRMIVLTSLLVWAAVGGVLAYVWFRRVPWDRLG
jgi:hypothetical protein